MPTLANYVVIRNNPVTLLAGNVQSFTFDAPDVDGALETILLFRIFPDLNAGLELEINGSVVFTVPLFSVVGGRSMHEVVPGGLLLPVGNTLTATNTGAANINFSGVALLFQT